MLTDLGRSLTMANTSAIGTKTAMAGSPGFQSPAQKKDVGPPSDVFSFGCVVITLFRGMPLKVTGKKKTLVCLVCHRC